jgi:hypothetical protein
MGQTELRLLGILRSTEHRGGPGLLLMKPRPSITWLCSDQLVVTNASMSTRVDVEDAFF